MKKRGLSNLVATVLIVLLALAAVAIVWGFLKPAFDKTGQLTELRSQCFTVDVQPVSCQFTAVDSDGADGADSYDATLRARLMSGEVSEILYVLEYNDTAQTTLTNRTSSIEALETATVMIRKTGDTSVSPDELPALGPARLTVAAVVSDGTAQEVCPESTPVNCVLV